MLHKQRVVYSFKTTTEAMKMERVCAKVNAPGGIIPLPSAIAAGCGLAWAVDEDDALITDIVIKENNININGRTLIYL
ncbi:MAG: DUF3343 domain-containing protein [Lachnospiraceae bacterium]|nr:DUF3343 domain-containing protein [Lachnospiraceae bacterium]